MTREERKAFARRAASEGIVLLKNENKTLPLIKEKEIALFGIHSYKAIKMGWGSGDMLAHTAIGLYDALVSQGAKVEKCTSDLAKEWIDAHCDEYAYINRHWGKWTVRYTEIETPDSAIFEARKSTDTAIVSVGRCAGEAFDFKDISGEYRLADDEIDLIKRVSKAFDRVVLVMNTAVLLDISSIDGVKVDAIVYTALCGEEYGNALADVLLGSVNPSGRLATTWAYNYSDYPTKDGFGTLKTLYTEGIYVGYRYFDTFNVPVRARFGEGLSYTSFEINEGSAKIVGTTVTFDVAVKNVGNYDGKDVIECYISAPDGKLEKAYRELATYKKTKVIKMGESDTVTIAFDLLDFASFDETSASFILEAGKYVVSITDGTRDIKPIFAVNISDEITVKKVSNRCKLIEKIDLLSKKGKNTAKMSANGLPVLEFCASIKTEIAEEPKANKLLTPRTDLNRTITLDDVKEGIATIEDVVAQFDAEELANTINGMIYDSKAVISTVGGSNKYRLIGTAGETWKSEKYGIPAGICADGPSGLRLSIFNTEIDADSDLAKKMVSYPSGTCLANSWNEDLLIEYGKTILTELEETTIEGWLAPGINIQRNPLCGRNFEYCSEDPLICGNAAAAITIGVQYNDDMSLTGKYTTVKHFACNNVEYERRENDSVISERALREIYLRGFEIAVKKSMPHAIMSSYNKVNGTHAATNFDLCMAILRYEWGFKGMVMTDWGNSAPPKQHYYAGNDLAMAGYFKASVIEGIKSGEIDIADAQKSAVRVLELIMKTTMHSK